MCLVVLFILTRNDHDKGGSRVLEEGEAHSDQLSVHDITGDIS